METRSLVSKKEPTHGNVENNQDRGRCRYGPPHIETHEVESALRSALYAHDRRLRDLHEEFYGREIPLRDEYLAVVSAITGGGGDEA